MLSVNTGILGKLASALMSGDENVLEQLIEKKLESMGEDLVMQLIGSALPGMGAASRVARAVETGGASEFNRLRSQWLSGLTPTPVPGTGMIRRLENAFNKNAHLLTRPEGKWMKWNRSRQQWLNEQYRHDWRTQPRDPQSGEWTPGRLRWPYVPKAQRRLRMARRRGARRMARELMRQYRS
jgi:hypothetical protein